MENIKIPQPYKPGEKNIRDIIAPAGLEVNPGYLKLGEKFVKTIFIFTYPRYLATGWFNPVINLPDLLDISIFVHPVDTAMALRNLRKKTAQIEAQLIERQEKGLVRDPLLETAFQDIEMLRDQLQQAQEKLFNIGVYVTIYADTLEGLNKLEERLNSLFESQLVYAKPAAFQQLDGLASTLPLNSDKLLIHTPLNSGPVSSLFPFVSVDLTSDEGILYGINRHNNTLVIFDRFSLENANSVVFAKAGAGKSILGSETVLIKKGGRIELTKIGDLIEKTIKKFGAVQIDEELEGVINPDIEVYSFDKNLKAEWSKVTVAARKTAPDVFYKFKTRSGREVTTTGDHNMLVLKNGCIMVAKSSEVKAGEFIPLPRNIQESSQPLQLFNLLELLRDSKNIYIQGAEELIKKNYQILKKAKINQKLDKYLYKYRSSRSIPIKYLLEILDYLKIKIDDVRLQELKIVSCNGKSKYHLNVDFIPSDSFLRLLGYIIAEGTVRDDVIIISNQDLEVIHDIEISLKSLKVPFYSAFQNKGIVIASRVFIEIVKALGGVGHSKNKKVLPFIFNSNKEKIAQFLSAYFEGDGGIEKHQIAATSKSSQLISEISYLLYYFGIIGRISKIKKKAPEWKHKKTYYRLIISGQENLKKFKENINFVCQKKRKALSEILLKEGNTNVDVVPEIREIFNEIYQLFSFQLSGISEISEWKRGIRNPSPSHLQKIINKIEERIKLFKDLAPVFGRISNLPSLESLIEIGKSRKDLNRALWQTLGESWRLMKNQEIKPGSNNVFKTIDVINGENYSLSKIKDIIHFGFKEMNLPIKYFNRSLQPALVDRPSGNTSYEMIYNASQFIWNNYQEVLLNRIPRIEARLVQLKTLANADLFWDPIVKIEKIKNKREKYVYDLTVNNEVFLAGQGGIFVHNSYACKLEIIRSLMLGIDVLVIDPENEYQKLAESVGGSFFKISLTSENQINPFEIPIIPKGDDPADIFKSHILNLAGLMKLMLGQITPEEEAILDRALTTTYESRDITPDKKDFTSLQPPLLEDFQIVLESMEGGQGLAKRLERFTKGSYAGFTNKPTNIDIKNRLIVFSVRDLEEQLRPIAIYIVLNFIWNLIRADFKKRVMIIDEAWWLMKYPDSAAFLFSLAKRCRKYFLGLTTITQNVEDFLESPYGRPIITNSALQLLLKQSPASIDVVAKTFNLSEAEKQLLLEADVGEGVFFAGLKHAAIQIIASYFENKIITTKPEELLEMEK